MSEYVIIENALATLLDELDGVKVRPYPDDAKELGRATVHTQIIFGYTRSTFTVVQESSPPNSSLVMDETANYEFTLKMKGLRTHQGCLPYLSAIKHKILGFYPIRAKHVRPFRPVTAGFKDVDEAIWYYSMTCACSFRITEGQQDYSEIQPKVTLPKEFVIKGGIWRSSPGTFDKVNSHLDTKLEFPQGTS